MVIRIFIVFFLFFLFSFECQSELFKTENKNFIPLNSQIRYKTTWYFIYEYSYKDENQINKKEVEIIDDKTLMKNQQYYIVKIKNKEQVEFLKNNDVLLFFDGDISIIKATEEFVSTELTGFKFRILPEIKDKKTTFKTFSIDKLQILEDKNTVENLINRLSTSTVYSYIKELQDFNTRFTFSTGCILSMEYIKNKFKENGLDVSTHSFIINNYERFNIIGEKKGLTSPEKILILCAHYDSIAPPYSDISAPGADDNASGVAGLLSLSKIICETQKDFNRTVRFIAFCGEEQGLAGSRNYVKSMDKNEIILGVINLDMIGYWKTGIPYDLDIITDFNSRHIFDCIWLITGEYQTTMTLNKHINDNALWSDHASFWDEGYYAVDFSEAYDWNTPDFNPYYHSILDTVDKLDMDFTLEIIKIAGMTSFHILDPVNIEETVIIEPDGNNDSIKQGERYLIRWFSNIQEKQISIYYTPSYDFAHAKLIANLPANINNYLWDTSTVQPGEYFICFADENMNIKFSSGRVTIMPVEHLKIRCYPNPFISTSNNVMVFSNLFETTNLRIYNITGEEVLNEHITGKFSWSWDTRNKKGEYLSSGVYIYYADAGKGKCDKGKFVIIR